MTPITTAIVAARLGCSGRTVRRHAAEHGIGTRLGCEWVFSEADVPRLAALVRPGPGCPAFTPGNRLGGRKKRST